MSEQSTATFGDPVDTPDPPDLPILPGWVEYPTLTGSYSHVYLLEMPGGFLVRYKYFGDGYKFMSVTFMPMPTNARRVLLKAINEGNLEYVLSQAVKPPIGKGQIHVD